MRDNGTDYKSVSATISHTDLDETPVIISGNDHIRTFLMPPSNVVVTATFKPTDATGIEQAPQSTALSAYVRNGILHLSGLSEGQTWRVHNITGMLVYQGVATGSKVTISLSAYRYRRNGNVENRKLRVKVARYKLQGTNNEHLKS